MPAYFISIEVAALYISTYKGKAKVYRLLVIAFSFFFTYKGALTVAGCVGPRSKSILRLTRVLMAFTSLVRLIAFSGYLLKAVTASVIAITVNIAFYTFIKIRVLILSRLI